MSEQEQGPPAPDIITARLFRQGQIAYHEGLDLDDNPLDITWMQRAWREGWIAAKDEELDGGQAVSTTP